MVVQEDHRKKTLEKRPAWFELHIGYGLKARTFCLMVFVAEKRGVVVQYDREILSIYRENRKGAPLYTRSAPFLCMRSW